MSNEQEEVEELRDRLNSLESKYDDLEMRYQSVVAKNESLKEIILGDLETYYDDVDEAPSLWEQVADLRSDTSNTNEKIRRLDSAGARGQPGAARVAKIRHALVRRATSGGVGTAQQAAKADSPALDYEDVLALFDYEISDGYASSLLDKAANVGGASAFYVKSPQNARDGRKTLRVDVGELDSDSPYLRSVRRGEGEKEIDFARSPNNEVSEGGG